MGRHALEIDKIVMDLILTDDIQLKKKIAKSAAPNMPVSINN